MTRAGLLPLAPPVARPAPPASPTRQAGAAFGDILQSLVTAADQQQQQAHRTVQTLHGGSEKNLHEAMIAMEQADISLRYLVQVRNKAIEAYQEIMRMQL